MPPRKIARFGDKPVGAGWRQPTQCADLGGVEPDTVVHFLLPVRIVGAPAGEGVEKLAANVGEIDGAAVGVFELDEAAAAASIAETLPFRRVEFLKGLVLPKVRGEGCAF